MRLIDLYFRAFRAFRKHTQYHSDSQKERKIIAQANANEDQFTSIKYTCEIDEDWIVNIEQGLISVEKALNEERQFIRSEGEIVPIEKAKRVSKATIEHLARHSGFITRKPENEGDPIIPDKLYIVEKLNDYAVYENRFLYMLLCYLRDFILIRTEKIRDKLTTYQSNMSMNKNIQLTSRHINYHLSYSDLYKNDSNLVDAYRDNPLIKRIDDIYANVLSYLSTPLMKEVAKEPMIKPPIVKTNTLRMNQNFKGALELYYYVTSYTKDGFTFTEVKKVFSPFPGDFSDVIAETIGLTSYITYSLGNDLKTELIKVYDEEELRIKEAEKRKTIEKLKRLKKRIVEMNEDPATYILTLENHNYDLEKQVTELHHERQKNAELALKISNLEKEKQSLNEEIINITEDLKQKDNEITLLNQKYIDDMIEAAKIHREEITQLVEQNNQKIASLQDEYELEKNALNEAYQLEYANLKTQHTQDKENIIHKYDGIIEELNNQKQDLGKIIEDNDQQIEMLKSKVEQGDVSRRILSSKLHAIRQQQGLISEHDDYTSKEKFKELELEMVAYKKFFKNQWKNTKKEIRKKVKKENASIFHKK